MHAELYRGSPGPYRGRAQTWRYRWRSSNGRIVAQGNESYENRQDAIDAIIAVSGSAMPIRDLQAELTESQNAAV